MMLGIKIKRKKKNDNELSGYSQNAEIVIRQESDVTLKKTIQFETKNKNKKIFNREFNENDIVDYTALVEKKQARNKNLKAEKEYQILLKRNRKLQIFFLNNEISVLTKRRRNVVLTNDDLFNNISQFKRQRSIAELKLTNLNFYYDKSYKEFKN